MKKEKEEKIEELFARIIATPAIKGVFVAAGESITPGEICDKAKELNLAISVSKVQGGYKVMRVPRPEEDWNIK
jgi:hypothetical protein